MTNEKELVVFFAALLCISVRKVLTAALTIRHCQVPP